VVAVEHQRLLSNEAEFEHWLAAAFEKERARLHVVPKASGSQALATERCGSEKEAKPGDAASA
jgi:hypothetical protein